MPDRHCSRAGCTKKLRSNNTTGMCSVNCEAWKDEAPVKAAPRASSRRASETMRSFKTVARALGKNPDAILEEAASTWLEAVRKAVE